MAPGRRRSACSCRCASSRSRSSSSRSPCLRCCSSPMRSSDRGSDPHPLRAVRRRTAERALRHRRGAESCSRIRIPVSWSTATQSGSTSDVITVQEAPHVDRLPRRRGRDRGVDAARRNAAGVLNDDDGAHLGAVGARGGVRGKRRHPRHRRHERSEPHGVPGLRLRARARPCRHCCCWRPCSTRVVGNVWHVTGADHGGITWPVTAAYVVMFTAAGDPERRPREHAHRRSRW